MCEWTIDKANLGRSLRVRFVSYNVTLIHLSMHPKNFRRKIRVQKVFHLCVCVFLFLFFILTCRSVFPQNTLVFEYFLCFGCIILTFLSFPNCKVDDKISFNQTEFWEANNNVAMKNSLPTFLNASKGE